VKKQVVESTPFLQGVVFFAGVSTLAFETVLPRLLAPFFGTAQPIWAIVIGTTLIFLATGYWLGGQIADRWPSPRFIYLLLTGAGLLAGFIPLLAQPILHFAQQALLDFAAGNLLAALGGILLLFALPITLVAAVSPFAVRLQMHREAGGIAAAGRAAGSISAISTLGSIMGAFLPTFYLIPTFGTRNTIYLLASLLLLLGISGLRDWRSKLLLLLIGILPIYALTCKSGFFCPTKELKSAACQDCLVLAETESAYNYIQVVSQKVAPDETYIYLILNEGFALHSISSLKYRQTHDPKDTLTGGGPWDYFAVAPYFYPQRDPQTVKSLALLGAAAGTIPKQFLALYGSQMKIDAVEIDAKIVELGKTYFDLAADDARYPNYKVYAEDARAWLQKTSTKYDLIGLDAYQQPYIPFHLATVEFFQAVKAHLNAAGVVAVNAARPPSGDERLVTALATTMRAVFPQVFIIETRQREIASNVILVGVKQPVGDGIANFQANTAQMQNPTLRLIMNWAINEGSFPLREFLPSQSQVAPFTDDHAPVESLIDLLLLHEAQSLNTPKK